MKIIETKENYGIYHKKVFGVEPESFPDHIFCLKGDDVIGFVAGHRNFDGMFYIEYAGILPQFRKGAYLRHIEKILKFVGSGFITAVDNNNIQTMKILLALNFIIMGFRTVKDKSYVEFMRG